MVPPSDDTPDEDVDFMAEMDAIASDSGTDDDGDEADSMAAEWEAMLGGDDDDDLGMGMGADQSTRVLNQDEIDSLLGFDEATDDGMDRGGIQAILNSALVSY